MQKIVIWIQISALIVNVKTDDIYQYSVEDVGTRFDSSNFETDRPLPKRKKKNVIELIKDELVEQIMKEFFRLREKQITT